MVRSVSFLFSKIVEGDFIHEKNIITHADGNFAYQHDSYRDSRPHA
jgi:hypothetical protein